ncbi:hypothetical protein [Saccharothrix sp.]|uniref:hypothetical protein n=1 Tax=Saccharothrix sp. TaxID=1873460 RepID=UPI002810BD45|nr:hypothetical protein [Saccharothrix sp.]
MPQRQLVRPLVIAFDVVETLFPLEPLGERLRQAGQSPDLLRLWFTRLLRWVSRFEGRWNDLFDSPDVTGPDPVRVVHQLLAVPDA